MAASPHNDGLTLVGRWTKVGFHSDESVYLLGWHFSGGADGKSLGKRVDTELHLRPVHWGGWPWLRLNMLRSHLVMKHHSLIGRCASPTIDEVHHPPPLVVVLW